VSAESTPVVESADVNELTEGASEPEPSVPELVAESDVPAATGESEEPSPPQED
jgi:hypothetical protein